MQQFIPFAATTTGNGGYTEARAPPHELLNHDTGLTAPDVVDFTTLGDVTHVGMLVTSACRAESMIPT
jgi:hypothetical protein